MSELKLHLGCGKRFLQGYVHIDYADFPHIDHKHDIATLPMFKDQTVDIIYASHSLEYFDRVEVPVILQEWYRVLKTGGLLRIAVPDFEALVNVYQHSSDLDLILGPLYGRWQVPGSEQTVFHKTVYDFTSLKRVLEANAFKNIRRWDWRKVFVKEHEGFDDYSQAYFPHMDKENGILVSLNVEAER